MQTLFPGVAWSLIILASRQTTEALHFDSPPSVVYIYVLNVHLHTGYKNMKPPRRVALLSLLSLGVFVATLGPASRVLRAADVNDSRATDHGETFASSGDKAGGHAMRLVNRARARLGLPALKLDVELQELAEERLQANVDRGDWRHNIRRGKLVGRFFPARAEGCGCTTDSARWGTCYVETRKHTKAGAAVRKVGNQYWQLLLVR